MKRTISGYYLLLLFLISSCTETGTGVPVSLTWSNGDRDPQTGYYDNTFTIKNISDKEIGNNWNIYYSQLPRTIGSIDTDLIKIELVNANYFRISPGDNYKSLQPGDSIVVGYKVSNSAPNISQQPEGCYWIDTVAGKESQPVGIDLKFTPLPDESLISPVLNSQIYNFNQKLSTNTVELKQWDIIPSVKNVTVKEEKMTIPSEISLLYSSELTSEAQILQEKLQQLYGIQISEVAPVSIRLDLVSNKNTPVNKEYYKLSIDTDRVVIEGASPHGVFNGIQTFLAFMKGRERPDALQCVSITDYPDLPHRGFMLDIARNFTSVSDLKSLVDIMASYKLNVLHFHFSDDEGWRLEIPGLEELTTVASRRGHTTDESTNLLPGYDGGFDASAATSGNGYYTRQEFIELLRYAKARYIRVIPEIESPGHARAAIVAMKARYNKYIGKDDGKANEYLLSDPEDKSVYESAQSYTDNVMCVAMPSVYNFMQKVITEIQEMYAEAGAELTSIHIGGDEVPAGAWEGSPLCRQFMQENGMNNTHELFEYFYMRLTSFLQTKGLQFNGWQEVALHNAPQTDKQLTANADGINCWNVVAEWGEDEIPYQLANKGYPVVLSNVNNFYMDLAYNPHYNEPGHSWAGYVDESKAFSVLPFSIYRSSRTDLAGNPVDIDKAESGKEPLNKASIPLIRGVQAHLFAETIRSFEGVQYYYFPKILGLVERGWNAHPVWENMRGTQEQSSYYKDLSRFYALISDKEMPCLHARNINFRLPNPGLSTDGNLLYANTSIRGAKIHYTTDGSEPTENSPVWTKPVEYNGELMKSCLFYLGKRSVTSILPNKTDIK